MATIKRVTQNDKVKQVIGDYHVAGSPLLVVTVSSSDDNLGGFKPWYDLKYQGFLFYFRNDIEADFELTVFVPWFDLVSQGFLFTTTE